MGLCQSPIEIFFPSRDFARRGGPSNQPRQVTGWPPPQECNLLGSILSSHSYLATFMRVAPPLSALLLICSLLGCLTGPNSMLSRDASLLPLDEPVELAPGEGLLLFEMETNEVMPELTMSSIDGGYTTLVIRDLQPGRRTHIMRVPAGRYAWRRLEIMGYEVGGKMYPYFLDLDRDDEDFHFDVKEGVANYPGLLVVSRKDRWITRFTINRSGQLARRVVDESRWMIEQYPLHYTGRRRDDFLEYYSERWTHKHLRGPALSLNQKPVGGEDASDDEPTEANDE